MFCQYFCISSLEEDRIISIFIYHVLSLEPQKIVTMSVYKSFDLWLEIIGCLFWRCAIVICIESYLFALSKPEAGNNCFFFFLCSSIFSYTHTYNNEAFIIICDRANVCLVDLFSPIFLWRKPRTFSYNNVSFRLLLHTLPYSRL